MTTFTALGTTTTATPAVALRTVSTAQHLAAFGLALVMTLGALASLDSLAQHEHDAATLAQANRPARQV